MRVNAQHKNARISAQKARLVADLIRFKELAHPRVDMVGHDVTHRVGQSNAGHKRHDRTRNNQIICGVKTRIACPDMSQQSKDEGSGKSCHKRDTDIFVNIQRERKAKEGSNGSPQSIVEISTKHDGEEGSTERCCWAVMMITGSVGRRWRT